MIVLTEVAQPGHRGIDVLAVICRSVSTHNRLVGYFRLDLDRAVEDAVVSVRAVGFQQLKVEVDEARLAMVGADATSDVFKSVPRPPKHVWQEKGAVYDVSGPQWQEITGARRFEPGSYTLGFTLEVPNWLPPTGESWLAKAHYEVRTTLTGKGPRRWFGAAEIEESALREMLVSAHPSSEGLEKLNPMDVRMRLKSKPKGESAFKPTVTARTANARYGGCFDLHVSLQVPKAADVRGVIVNLNAQLAQEWRVAVTGRDEPIQGVDQIELLKGKLSDSAIDVSALAAADPAPPYFEDFTNCIGAHADAPNESSTTSKSATASETSSLHSADEVEAKSTLVFSRNLHFPDEAASDAGGFYPSTLSFTKVSVSFQHILSCTLSMTLRDGQRLEWIFDADIRLVGRDLATDRLVVPPYQPSMQQVDHSKGNAQPPAV